MVLAGDEVGVVILGPAPHGAGLADVVDVFGVGVGDVDVSYSGWCPLFRFQVSFVQILTLKTSHARLVLLRSTFSVETLMVNFSVKFQVWFKKRKTLCACSKLIWNLRKIMNFSAIRNTL